MAFRRQNVIKCHLQKCNLAINFRNASLPRHAINDMELFWKHLSNYKISCGTISHPLFNVVGKLGPTLHFLGVSSWAPGTQLSRAQLSTFRGRTVGPGTVRPLDSWAPRTVGLQKIGPRSPTVQGPTVRSQKVDSGLA